MCVVCVVGTLCRHGGRRGGEGGSTAHSRCVSVVLPCTTLDPPHTFAPTTAKVTQKV